MADYYSKDEILRKSKMQRLWHHILMISKGECDITDEHILNEKDEEFRLILGGLQLLHDDLVNYKEDITQKLEADHQLEILKKRNDELAQFNYVASHDLQTPLLSIKSFSDLLLKEHSENLNDEGVECLKYINTSAQRMSKLIFSLLNYSRIGRDFHAENINLNQILNEVLDDFKLIIEEAKPILYVNDLPSCVVNRVAIYQLFTNLLSNAFKFRNKNRVLEITISSVRKESFNLFMITDNGIGIEKNNMGKIFEVFRRLHNESQYEGTGIGLSSCKKIVEMHNGKIWAESEIGNGTTFFFTLPYVLD